MVGGQRGRVPNTSLRRCSDILVVFNTRFISVG